MSKLPLENCEPLHALDKAEKKRNEAAYKHHRHILEVLSIIKSIKIWIEWKRKIVSV